MKGLVQYISEAINMFEATDAKNLTQSDDETKNKIMSYLKDFKIRWSVKTVDSAINEITKDRVQYYKEYLTPEEIKGSDKIYIMKCWNDGFNLDKSSRYNCADIVDYNNNTDVFWLLLVKGKSVTVFSVERKYYGLKDTKKQINKFRI